MIEFHRYANLFPMIEDAPFEEFSAAIRERGVIREKIVIYPDDGVDAILDGRNRYRAGTLVGLIDIDWDVEELIAAGFAERYDEARHGDPLAWVIDRNLHHRHLTDRQRVMIAAEISTLKPGRPSEWKADLNVAAGAEGARRLAGANNPANWPDSSHVKPSPHRGLSQAESAKRLGVPERQVRRGVQVFETGVPELVEAAKRGDMAISAAEQIARLPADEQRRLVEAGAVSGARSIMASRAEPSDSLDFFPTPPWATRALVEDVLPALGVDLARHSVWEPACGEGHMTGVLWEYGGLVCGTDIFDYGAEGRSVPAWLRPLNFLLDEPLSGYDWLVSNPPFEPALDFVLRAIATAGTGVAMFVRSQWAVEGVERYERLFRDNPPTLCAYFSERVNLCKGRWDPEGSTATAYCWLIWIKGAAPRPPMWIPPGRRIARTKPDDVQRFTAHPVLRPADDEQALGEALLQLHTNTPKSIPSDPAEASEAGTSLPAADAGEGAASPSPSTFPAAAEGSGATGGTDVGGGGEVRLPPDSLGHGMRVGGMRNKVDATLMVKQRDRHLFAFSVSVDAGSVSYRHSAERDSHAAAMVAAFEALDEEFCRRMSAPALVAPLRAGRRWLESKADAWGLTFSLRDTPEGTDESDESSPEAGRQAEASLAGTGTGTPADRDQPASEGEGADVALSPALSNDQINAIISAGYAAEPQVGVAELARRTGLSRNAVKKRAARLDLSSAENQRAAVAESNRRRGKTPGARSSGEEARDSRGGANARG